MLKNAVLMSINPEHCVNIALGRKTLEIRTKQPDFSHYSKVYIYCTSVKRLPLKQYAKLHQETGGMIDEWAGKVFAAFDCDYIYTFVRGKYPEEFMKRGMVDRDWIDQHAKGRPLYGLHISDLRIFDNPFPLDQFYCTWHPMKRPPQSWCYVTDQILTLKDVMQGGQEDA